MATIKAGVKAFLEAAAITPNIWEGELPEDPELPATVFHIIDDIATVTTHDGKLGPFNARLQLEVIAEDVDTVEAAMESYYSLLVPYSGIFGAGFNDVAIFDEGANPDLNFENEPTLRDLEGRSHDFLIVY